MAGQNFPETELTAAYILEETLGYRHPDYAQSLAGFGTPRKLPHSDGWIIQRPIPGHALTDGMGPYPIFSCRDWLALPADIEALRADGLVSLTLATEPTLGEREQRVFNLFDHVIPFKTHYLAELDRPPEAIASSHHRYYARRASRVMQIEVAENPLDHLDEWCALYQQIVLRHSVGDLRAFSRESFARLLDMPGVYLFRASFQGKLVGAQVILLQGEVAYAHLSAFTEEGYRHGASYLLDWHALESMRGLASHMNWGGGRHAHDGQLDGLARYKLGWSTLQMNSWLIGSILDRDAYQKLCNEKPRDPATSYFPLYRQGEFG